MRIHFTVPLLFVALFATASPAQPLIDRVPSNAIAYFGWTGAGAMGPGYEGSHFQAVLKATNFTKVLSDATAQMSQAAVAKDPHAAQGIDTLTTLAAATWNNPCAFYVCPVPPSGKTNEPIYAVVLWQVGPGGAEFAAKLKSALKLTDVAGKPDAPKVVQFDTFVGVYLGVPNGVDITAKPAQTLADNMAFKQAITKVRANAAAIAYADTEAVVALINKEHATTTDDQFKENWPKVREAMGLAGLKRIIWSAGFDGQDWATETFVEAAAPRKGLLKLMDAPPVSVDMLKLIPKNAVWFSTMHWDLAALLDDVRTSIRSVDPNGMQRFDQSLLQANQIIGVDFEKQLIHGLGPDWVIYTDPSAVGPNGLGFVAVNPLRDAEQVDAALSRLEQFANGVMAAKQAPGPDGRPAGPNFQFQVTDQQGLKVHTINAMFLAPSWAVHDKKLYFSLLPQGVVAAAIFRESSPGSILDNEKYVSLRKRLGGQTPGSITFVDLPETAMGSYQGLVMLTQILSTISGQHGPNPLSSMMPPLAAILLHLAPGGSVAWADGEGYHSRGLLPFPGAGMLGPQGSQLSVSQVALVTGIMLPALGAARRTATQMQASTQLRGIHQGMRMFATNNQDKYPNNMGQLLEGNYFTRAYTVSPTASHKPDFPADFDQWPTEKKGQWLEENGSFVILRWGQKESEDSKVIAGYLKPSDSTGTGTSIVFDDNHVEWVTPMSAAVAKIKAQYPDHQIKGYEAPAPAPR